MKAWIYIIKERKENTELRKLLELSLVIKRDRLIVKLNLDTMGNF